MPELLLTVVLQFVYFLNEMSHCENFYCCPLHTVTHGLLFRHTNVFSVHSVQSFANLRSCLNLKFDWFRFLWFSVLLLLVRPAGL